MNITSGVCVATVTGLDDPEGEARVRVEFPMLPSGPKSTWAPLARPFAGADRGMYYMPEVGDEALVAFEHGDFNHPFIVGFLWNGEDRPPDDGIDENVRRIQSKTGHRIDMDDRLGAGRITLRTAGGSTVELSDGPVGARITVSTLAGQGITITDQSISVTSTGVVSISCGQAAVTAGSATVTGNVTVAGNLGVAGNVIAVGTVTGQSLFRIGPSGPVMVT